MKLGEKWLLLMVAAVIVASLVGSCARRVPEAEVMFEEEEEEWALAEEKPIEFEEVAVPETTEIVLEPEPVVPQPPRQVYGYRVQVIAASRESTALKMSEAARLRFDERVYVDYEPPYYKVRVGDCYTKEEAQALRERAVEEGYTDAFIVEIMINAVR